MTEASFLEEFILAVDPIDPSLITMETILTSIPEWDSLAILGVIVMFEISFDKVIVGEALAQAFIVKDVFNLI